LNSASCRVTARRALSKRRDILPLCLCAFLHEGEGQATHSGPSSMNELVSASEDGRRKGRSANRWMNAHGGEAGIWTLMAPARSPSRAPSRG
jgi:hypothetical protein